jgi:predicted nucleic acid-binding protein
MIGETPETVRFWDSSAITPLISGEPTRNRLVQLLDEDADIIAWWTTPVEVASALARREREGLITAEEAAAALGIARNLSHAWHEIAPSEAIRRTAERLLRVHPLRAADSLQLAAALIAADHDPNSLTFVCLDARLAAAAQREGFSVLR